MREIIATIQDFWQITFLYNALWQWAMLLAVLLGSLLAGRLGGAIIQRQVRRLGGHDLLKVLISSAVGPATMLIFAGGFYLSQTFMTLDVQAVDGQMRFLPAGPIRTFWMQTAQTIAAFGIAWLIYRLVDLVEHLLERWASGTSSPFAAQLVPLIRKTLRVFIVIIAGLFVAQNIFQMNVAALLAGLGIGGLALALAAQETIANFFGSVIIFTDQPFVVGERIKVREFDGVVKEIGFRSTKMSLLSGELVTIPNSIVSKEPVQNFDRRSSTRRVMNIGLTCDTPPAKLRRAVAIVQEILKSHADKMPADQPPRVYFSELNPDNLNIAAYYWHTSPNLWQCLETAEQINLQLLERFSAEGIEFAFPTHTIHVAPAAPQITMVAGKSAQNKPLES